MTRFGTKLLGFAVVIAIATLLFFGSFVLLDAQIAYASGEISVWDGSIDTSWYVGHEGDTSYNIETAAQLAGLSSLTYANEPVDFSGKTINLMTNIDLNGCKEFETYEHDKTHALAISFTDIGSHYIWSPIKNFAGEFNGNNKTIYNMSVNEGTSSGLAKRRGFFATLTSTASVHDLTVKDAIVSGYQYVGVVVGSADASATLQNLEVCNSTIYLSDVSAGGIVGYGNSLSNCIARDLTVDCSLGGTQNIGGIIGDSSSGSGTMLLTDCEVYNFSVINGTPSYVGLFGAINPGSITLVDCKTNISGDLGSGEFTVVESTDVVYQNIDRVRVGGNILVDSGLSPTSYAYDATGMHENTVAIAYVATPTSISINCTGADEPVNTLDRRILSFTIPSTATALTVTAVINNTSVVASFEIGENNSAYSELNATLDEFKTAVSNLGGANIIADAQALYSQYNSLLLNKTSSEIDYINTYLDGYLDFASQIAQSIQSVGAITYGDLTVSATLLMVDGSAANTTADIVSFSTTDTLGATVNKTMTYSGTEYTLSFAATSVARKQLSITIDNKTSIYGNELVPLTYQPVSLVNGDNASDIISLTKAAGVNVGEYAITGTCSHIGYDAQFANGTYTISKRSIQIVIGDASSCYGDPLATIPCHAAAALPYDDDIYDIVLLSVADFDASIINAYDIEFEVINNNYVVACQNEVPATYTYSKRPISIIVNNKSSVYGESIKPLTWELANDTTLATGDEPDEVITLFKDGGNDAGEYEIQVGWDFNYSVNVVRQGVYTIEKQDVSSHITLSLANGAQVVQSTPCTASIDIANLQLVYSLMLGGQSVENTSKVGEYTFTATVQNANYSGSKSAAFTVYENVEGKITRLATLLATFKNPQATDEERIEALFSAQSIYSNLTTTDLLQIENNQDYQAEIASFVESWDTLRNSAESDLTVAEKTYDNLIAIVIAATSASLLLGFAFIKAFIG